MPDDKMYADLAEATTPEEVMSVLDKSGATLSYDSEPPADGQPPMDEPPPEEPGADSEAYSDGDMAPETGRRATILSIVKKNLNKSDKPEDDEGMEKEE